MMISWAMPHTFSGKKNSFFHHITLHFSPQNMAVLWIFCYISYFSRKIFQKITLGEKADFTQVNNIT